MSEFSQRLQDMLEAEADDIAVAWVERLERRRTTEPSRSFPRSVLIKHIPPLLRAIAPHLDGGEPFGQPEIAHKLRQLALLRRSQGYGPDELLEEFELLSNQVFTRVLVLVDDFDQKVRPAAIVVPVDRLRRLLDRLGSVTVRLYRTELTSNHLEREQILTEFGRAVTHELRNRLSSASLAVHLLDESLDPRERRAHIGEILQKLARSLRRVEHVVGDVFAVSMVRKPRDPNQNVYEPLSKVVAEVLVDLEAFAREREVKLSVSELYDVRVDAAYARLLLINLVSNSIKYCDPAKRDRWVRISARLEDDERWVMVQVVDNGLGIDREQQPKVFERLVRASKDPNVGGEGIGLYTASQAARRLGSELELTSTEGQGSEFSFRVPLPGESFS